MLDYKELREIAKKRISEISDEEMLIWLTFDKQREAVSKLAKGEVARLSINTKSSVNLADDIEVIDPSAAGEYYYAMAA